MTRQIHLSVALCPICDDWLFHKQFRKLDRLPCINCGIEIPVIHVFLVPQQTQDLVAAIESIKHDRQNPPQNA